MSIERETYQRFLRDLGTYVREQGLAAKKQRDVARAVAYAEVISAMQDYLRAFEIPFEEMSLQGFDPDAELL